MANELEVTGNLFAEIERHIHSNAETLHSIKDKLPDVSYNQICFALASKLQGLTIEFFCGPHGSSKVQLHVTSNGTLLIMELLNYCVDFCWIFT